MGVSGQLAGEAGVQVQAAVVQLGLEQVQGLLDHVVERGGLELRRGGPDRLQELGDDVVEPVDLAAGDAEVLFELAGLLAGIGFVGEAAPGRGRAGRSRVCRAAGSRRRS